MGNVNDWTFIALKYMVRELGHLKTSPAFSFSVCQTFFSWLLLVFIERCLFRLGDV